MPPTDWKHKGPLADPEDFTIVLGGPLFQLFRRAHMSGDALELAHRRILAGAALTWLPLLILSAIQGRALGDAVAIPFLHDIDAYARFLLVVPLLIGAELLVHLRIKSVARQFLDRELIPPSSRDRFDAAVESSRRWRNSIVAEVAIIALVYALGIGFVWRHFSVLPTSTWYANPSPDGLNLTYAGWWYVYVSIPVAQFLFLRWYYRIFIWARFLWQTSRMKLHLVATHPDRFGGLGFLSLTPYAFMPLVLAHSTLAAAWMGDRILVHQASLLDFKVEIVALIAWLAIIVFGPLLAYWPVLMQAWYQGEQEYGPLAERYVHDFERKWVKGDVAPRSELLGTSDIQSLADIGNAYSVVRSMKAVPITKRAAIQLLATAIAPLTPLLLTLMPLGELVKRLVGLMFGRPGG